MPRAARAAGRAGCRARPSRRREDREHRIGEARREPLDVERVVHPHEAAARARRDAALPRRHRVDPAVGQAAILVQQVHAAVAGRDAGEPAVGRGPERGPLPHHLPHRRERQSERRRTLQRAELLELAIDEGDRRLGLRPFGWWRPTRRRARRRGLRPPATSARTACAREAPRRPAGTAGPTPEVPRYQPRLSNDRAAAVKRATPRRGSTRICDALACSEGMLRSTSSTRAGATGRAGARPGDGTRPPRGSSCQPGRVRRNRPGVGSLRVEGDRLHPVGHLALIPELELRLEVDPAVGAREPEGVVERIDQRAEDAGHERAGRGDRRGPATGGTADSR